MTHMARVLLYAIGISGAVSLLHAQEDRISGTGEIYESRPFLRWERPQYQNFAIDHFGNYPNHWAPYDDARRSIYGPMG